MREIELPAVNINVPRRCFGFCRRYGSPVLVSDDTVWVHLHIHTYQPNKPTRPRTNLHEDGTGLLYVCVRERYVGGLEYLYLGTCICIFVHISCVLESGVKTGFRWCILRTLGKCDRSHRTRTRTRTIWCNLLVLAKLNRTLCALYKVDLSIYLLFIHRRSLLALTRVESFIVHTSYVLAECKRVVRGRSIGSGPGPGIYLFDEMRSISELSIGRKNVPILLYWLLLFLLFLACYIVYVYSVLRSKYVVTTPYRLT